VLKQQTLQWTATTANRAGLDAKLAAAHSKLEKKFLEGGAVLIAISDVLKRLIGSLDNLTGALDGKTTSETIERIQATARELASLPNFELSRQQGFEKLTKVCKAMQDSVGDMRETMRYLKTFAVTVKITGAGIAEFAGFADEIRDRIQSGSDEVNKFATQLSAMHQQLAGARVFSTNISKNYGDIVPKIVYELEHNAKKVAEHHKNLAQIANEVKTLARGIQGKIATVLSALQIGDITRQRIEHIRSSFVFFDEFRATSGSALDADAIARLDGAISQLAAAQMEEIAADFQRECRTVLENMSRFVDDTRDILALRDQMQRQSDGSDSNVLSGLETNVAAASKLVGSVHETSQQADAVAISTSGTAQSLLQGIEIIRSIKTDIHYMALNSNLRCSKLGDEGRSVNVVSGELRFFAEKLEAPANAVLSELQHFEAAAGSLSKDKDEGGDDDVSKPLNDALEAIRQVSGRMDASIREFEREGQEVFTKVSAAIGSLDFESELGEVLQDCVETAHVLADIADGDISDIASDIAELSSRIFRVYTMASERDIHRHYFPVDMPAEAAPAAPKSDEDLFEDALF
jgi:hypothetical protein